MGLRDLESGFDAELVAGIEDAGDALTLEAVAVERGRHVRIRDLLNRYYDVHQFSYPIAPPLRCGEAVSGGFSHMFELTRETVEPRARASAAWLVERGLRAGDRV